MIFTLSVSQHFSGFSNVFDLCQKAGVMVLAVEYHNGVLHLQIRTSDRPVQGKLASQFMQLPGVRWVEKTEQMPSEKKLKEYSQLFKSNPLPALLINRQAEIQLSSDQAQELFADAVKKNNQLKNIFVDSEWQHGLDRAVHGAPVCLKTISGEMMVHVQEVSSDNPSDISGAILTFQPVRLLSAISNSVGSCLYRESLIVSVPSNSIKQLKKRIDSMASIQANLLLVSEGFLEAQAFIRLCHKTSIDASKLYYELLCPSMNVVEQYDFLFGEVGVLYELEQKNGLLAIIGLEFLDYRLQQQLSQWLIDSDGNVKIMASIGFEPETASSDKILPNLLVQLDVLRLSVPPLNEHIEDIEFLVLGCMGEFRQWLGKPELKFSTAALDVLKSYHWPGHFMQMQQVVFAAVLNVSDGLIKESDITIHQHIEMDLYTSSLSEAMADFEKLFLSYWYRKYPSTRRLAAKLGVSHTTVAQKLNKYQLN